MYLHWTFVSSTMNQNCQQDLPILGVDYLGTPEKCRYTRLCISRHFLFAKNTKIKKKQDYDMTELHFSIQFSLKIYKIIKLF